MTVAVQCPPRCMCSHDCQVATIADWLKRMFGPYADIISYNRSRVIFSADSRGKPGRRLVYELTDFTDSAIDECAIELLKASASGEEVYFQPNLIKRNWPRPIPGYETRGRKNTRRKASAAYVDVYRSVGIFVDVDVQKRKKDSPYSTDEETTLAARKVIEDAGLSIASIVHSGSGRHFHIRLELDPLLQPEDIREYTGRIIALLHKAGIPCDANTRNAVQVARIPGTLNHKPGARNPRVQEIYAPAWPTLMSRAQLDALPVEVTPTGQSIARGRYKLPVVIAEIFEDRELIDEGFTRYRYKLTKAERQEFNIRGENDSNGLPARDPRRKQYLPERKDQNHRSNSHSDFDFNSMKVSARALDGRLRATPKGLLRVVKIVGVEHYDLRLSRGAGRKHFFPVYWTVTALNACFAGSPAFRDNAWMCAYRLQKPGKLPRRVLDAHAREFVASRDGRDINHAYRSNRLMRDLGYIYSQGQWVNADTLNARRQANKQKRERVNRWSALAEYRDALQVLRNRAVAQGGRLTLNRTQARSYTEGKIQALAIRPPSTSF